METQLTLTHEQQIQDQLAREFDSHESRVVGNTTLTYLTGEQVTSRLNEALGIFGWQYRIVEHGYNQEADEIWALGELTCWNPLDRGITVTRQQFGSNKLKRSRTTQAPLDIGFDLKGAATDALKKCATLVGVGLYLYDTEEVNRIQEEEQAQRQNAATPARTNVTQIHAGSEPAPVTLHGTICAQCDEELKEIRFRDGTVWTPELLASYGIRKHGRVLCMDHYREANEAKKRGETLPATTEAIPF